MNERINGFRGEPTFSREGDIAAVMNDLYTSPFVLTVGKHKLVVPLVFKVTQVHYLREKIAKENFDIDLLYALI